LKDLVVGHIDVSMRGALRKPNAEIAEGQRAPRPPDVAGGLRPPSWIEGWPA
jgi:hypothetical protein